MIKNKPLKPGVKTTEFWISLGLTLLGGTMASGLVNEGSTIGQIIGSVLALFSQLGYTASRAKIKKAEIKIQKRPSRNRKGPVGTEKAQ